MHSIGFVLVTLLLRPAETQKAVKCTNANATQFKNLEYPLEESRFTGGREDRLRVVNGRYEEPHAPLYNGYLYFEVRDIVFGDLTGDGVDDAAVVAVYGSASGSFYVTDTYTFSCTRGMPSLVGVLRQEQVQKDGGVEIFEALDHPTRIRDGALEVTYETRQPPGSPYGPTTFRYKLVGKAWQRQGDPIRRIAQ